MNVQLLDKNEWLGYLLKCPTATFFHTPMWYEIWDKYSRNKSYCKQFDFNSGNTAVFPYASTFRAKKMIKQLVSSPVGTYGGIISSTGLYPEEIMMLEESILKETNFTIRNNPFGPGLNFSTKEIKEDFTQVLNLETVSSHFYKGWTKGHRAAVRKGKKDGITIHIAKIEEWSEYYDLYIETTKRWKREIKYPYKPKLFNYIRQINNGNQKLWVAKYNNIVVAGALCFYFNKHVVYWHGAASKKYFKYKPVHVLIDHIIKDAVINKYGWFDFNPSSGLEGVVKFKKGFGTKKLKSDILRKESFNNRLISKLISLIKES